MFGTTTAIPATVLICHEGAVLDREGLASWLGSCSVLRGIIVVRDPARRTWRRIRTELRRVGWLRLADVLAFRAYYSLFLARRDRRWTYDTLATLQYRYPPQSDVPVLHTTDVNSPDVERFLKNTQPDIVIARCKVLLHERIFTIARRGTFVFHPGICPEYRNAHGCFWALATGDRRNVGMTLLRIDRGVDTGPVYGYFSYPFDERRESHHVIQQRVVLDNLDALGRALLDIACDRARPIPTDGRPSAVWGQPWLTQYLKWQIGARRRQ
jgi:folate-dependent phosphoribosylglycinamide formyltransferase PurN